jgi:glycosyltransferase involved in cell wall biosynthesis
VDFSKNVFGGFSFHNKNLISDESKVIFVSDMFVSDYTGGAELTLQALIDACPFDYDKVNSKDVSLPVLEKGKDKYWIFGNISALDANLFPTIVANLQYSIIEFDYKFCRYRSIEKHQEVEGKSCDCHDEMWGKMISAFFYGSRSLWWMSEKQMKIHHDRFPFYSEKHNTVLSSVFDDNFFARVKLLNEKYKDNKNDAWVVLGSTSWIKGAEECKEWCEENNKRCEEVWNLPYNELLEKLAQCAGLVFLPKGGDTCPRIVIEAKMLGCDLHLNENVQHKDEIWFDTEDPFDTEAYLYASRSRFWNGIRSDMEYKPTISGYTTTLNCNKHNYPWRQTIRSLLGFCDEVVVVDGGSDDGTWSELQEWSSEEENLKVYQQERDWSHKRFAVFDGAQKAVARSLCTKEFCWQMDCDEVVDDDHFHLIKGISKNFPSNADLLALPVIEYWGGEEKIRFDVNPWKWRLSKNKPYITHGIPANLRKFDENGDLYSAPGSDGCDYIRNDNYEQIPFATFVTQDVENARQMCANNEDARNAYQAWLNHVCATMPIVHHFSWWNLERKIKTYRDYWGKHWKSLFDQEVVDTPKNNMMFDCKWEDVSDEMIKERAKSMKKKLGGWIWHNKWDGEQETHHISLNINLPKIIKEWPGFKQ